MREGGREGEREGGGREGELSLPFSSVPLSYQNWSEGSFSSALQRYLTSLWKTAQPQKETKAEQDQYETSCCIL